MSVPRPPGFCKRNLDTENSAKVWKNGKTVAIHLKKNNGNLHPEPSPSPDFPFHFSYNGRFTPAIYPLRYCFGIASVLVRSFSAAMERREKAGIQAKEKVHKKLLFCILFQK